LPAARNTEKLVGAVGQGFIPGIRFNNVDADFTRCGEQKNSGARKGFEGARIHMLRKNSSL
jgi:hypothetical protein